jgi:hypothetical protein
MKRGTYREALLESMRELHSEGDMWLYLDNIGQRVTDHDRSYAWRYRQLNRVLSMVGIERPEQPTKITSRRKLSLTINRLEQEETVVSLWENSDADIPDQRGKTDVSLSGALAKNLLPSLPPDVQLRLHGLADAPPDTAEAAILFWPDIHRKPLVDRGIVKLFPVELDGEEGKDARITEMGREVLALFGIDIYFDRQN